MPREASERQRFRHAFAPLRCRCYAAAAIHFSVRRRRHAAVCRYDCHYYALDDALLRDAFHSSIQADDLSSHAAAAIDAMPLLLL